MSLPPIERAELVEKTLAIFELPDRERIDLLWGEEAEVKLWRSKDG